MVGAFGADDDDRPVNLRRAGRLRVLQAVHAEAVNAGNGLSRLDLRIMFDTGLLIVKSLVHRDKPVPADNRTIDASSLAAANKKIA